MRTTRGQAFTLIELLIVIGIIAILAGLLMPVMTIAGNRAAVTSTEAVLRKAETALDMFRGEMRTYPYQKHDNANPTFDPIDNRLGWVLAHDMTPAERADLDSDLAAVRAAYGLGGMHEIDATEVDSRVNVVGNDPLVLAMHAGLASRLAAERASMAVLSGNVTIKGVMSNKLQTVVGVPKSSGVAVDYLSGELTPRELRGDAIIDHWGRPLFYNCPMVQGVRDVYSPSGMFWNTHITTIHDKLPPVSAEYYGLLTIGREEAVDMSYDQRTHAAPTYRFRYEVWSAGPDGLVHPQRDHAWNKDNVAATAYDEELQ